MTTCSRCGKEHFIGATIEGRDLCLDCYWPNRMRDDVYQAYVRDNAERDHLAQQVLDLSKALAWRERDFQALAEAAAISPEEPTTCFDCTYFGKRECAYEPLPISTPCADYLAKED